MDNAVSSNSAPIGSSNNAEPSCETTGLAPRTLDPPSPQGETPGRPLWAEQAPADPSAVMDPSIRRLNLESPSATICEATSVDVGTLQQEPKAGSMTGGKGGWVAPWNVKQNAERSSSGRSSQLGANNQASIRDVYTYTQRHLLRIYPAAWKVDSR